MNNLYNLLKDDHIPKNPGLIDAPLDKRNWKYGAIFGEEKDLPRKFKHTYGENELTIYQGQVPECVSCAETDINQHNSNKEGNKITLSPRKVHAETGEYGRGRMVLDVIKHVQKKGQPQDKYCPNDVSLSEAEFMNVGLTIEGVEDADKRKIGPYTWIDSENRNELLSAIYNSPIMITVGGNNIDWRKDIIKQENEIKWYHAAVAFGYDLDEGVLYVRNWWRKDGKDIRKLDINYPLTSALSFRDLPDNKEKTMIKTVRAKGTIDTYTINGNQKNLITDSDTLHYFLGVLPIFEQPIEISQEELNKYVEGEPIPSVKLMRSFREIGPDILLKNTD